MLAPRRRRLRPSPPDSAMRAFDSGREVALVVPADAHDAAVADADDAGADGRLGEREHPRRRSLRLRSRFTACWATTCGSLQGVGQMRRNSGSRRGTRRHPPDVPVFWIVNRVVDAAERKLTSARRRRKTLSGRCCRAARRCGTRSACSRVTRHHSPTKLNNANATATAKRTDTGNARRRLRRRKRAQRRGVARASAGTTGLCLSTEPVPPVRLYARTRRRCARHKRTTTSRR